MENFIISGIQQMGIGVSNVQQAWKWYRTHFGMDIRILEDNSVAKYMLPYTGNKPQKRHAVLALNIQGGGGLEIWQYTQRIPMAPLRIPQMGDLGFFACKMKSFNIAATHQRLTKSEVNVTELLYGPSGEPLFFVTDPFNNVFEFLQCHDKFTDDRKDNGGVYGAIIGVSSIDNALPIYQDILGFDHIVYDIKGIFNEFSTLNGGKHLLRRMLLENSSPRKGPFSKLLGNSQIELIQLLDEQPVKIFEGRYWGDLGFIHLCFDTQGFIEIAKMCKSKGHPFTVNTMDQLNNSFDMGDAAGHFSYIEDSDGTLIEFVETHKLPVIKKIGWYLDITKRKQGKALPEWILKSLKFSRVN